MKLIFLLFLSGVFQISNGNPTGDIKIVNGEDAVLGQFPYQVLWAYEGNVLCGGSIYNKSTIITAAHCCKVFEEGEQAEGLLELTSIMAGFINITDIVVHIVPTTIFDRPKKANHTLSILAHF